VTAVWLPPELRGAVEALGEALGTANPRGRAVHGAARAVGRAAYDAGCALPELEAELGRAVAPVLRAHHPGGEGDWLWERALSSVGAAYSDARVGVPDGAPPRGSAPIALRPRHTGAEPRLVARRPGTAPDALAAAPDPKDPAQAPVVYRLDADDVITRVNAAWGAWAEANGAGGLADGVVGTSLWSHVTGEGPRRLYADVHAAVRRTGRAVTLRYRCDAPATRRWMRLVIRPIGRGHLQVASTLVRYTERTPVPLLDPAAPRDARRVRMCSLCHRVRGAGDPDDRRDHPGDAWLDVEAASAARPAPAGAAAGDPQPGVVHDVCPDCAADVREVLARATA
jgi:hypothetical protein